MFASPASRAVIAATLAFGLTATAVPAVAKSNGASQKKVELTVRQHKGETQYCKYQPVETGSILSKKVCQTREEWAEEGLIIDAPDVASSAKDNDKAG